MPLTEKCPILPRHIDASEPLLHVSADEAMNKLAAQAVRLAQKHGAWVPFTANQLFEEISIPQDLSEKSQRAFWIGRMVHAGFFQTESKHIAYEARQFAYTEVFVSMCFHRSRTTDGLVTDPADVPAPDAPAESEGSWRPGIHFGPPSSVRMADELLGPTQTC